MYNLGRVSRTQEIEGVTVKTIVNVTTSGTVDMMVKADGVIVANGYGIDYSDVTETLLNFTVAVHNYLSEKDKPEQLANRLANRLSKLGFKKEE